MCFIKKGIPVVLKDAKQEWLDAGRVRLADLPEREHIVHPLASIPRRQRTFGYAEEEVRKAEEEEREDSSALSSGSAPSPSPPSVVGSSGSSSAIAISVKNSR